MMSPTSEILNGEISHKAQSTHQAGKTPQVKQEEYANSIALKRKDNQTRPRRRFADILADTCARLGVDAVRYSFIVVDLHYLLLAGLPAHLCENALT